MRCFRWGVEHGPVPAVVGQQLEILRYLQRGRTQANEVELVEPAPWPVVAQTLPRLRTALQDAVNVQWLCGCRPGDVVRTG